MSAHHVWGSLSCVTTCCATKYAQHDHGGHDSRGYDVLTKNYRAAAADLEEAAATGQKLEYGWTSINFLLPAVLLFSDAIFGLAAGMTVKCAARHPDVAWARHRATARIMGRAHVHRSSRSPVIVGGCLKCAERHTYRALLACCAFHDSRAGAWRCGSAISAVPSPKCATRGCNLTSGGIALRAVFPVYFKTAVNLSPAMTNAVLATTPLFLAPFSFVARYLGRHIGAHQELYSVTTALSQVEPMVVMPTDICRRLARVGPAVDQLLIHELTRSLATCCTCTQTQIQPCPSGVCLPVRRLSHVLAGERL